MSKAEKRLLSFLDDIVLPKHQGTTPTDKVKVEIHKYVDEEPVAEPSLLWWKMNGARYSYLLMLLKSIWIFLQLQYQLRGHLA